MLGQPRGGAATCRLRQPTPRSAGIVPRELSETGWVVLRRVRPSRKPKFCQALCDSCDYWKGLRPRFRWCWDVSSEAFRTVMAARASLPLYWVGWLLAVSGGCRFRCRVPKERANTLAPWPCGSVEPVQRDSGDHLGCPRALLLPCVMPRPLAVRLGVTNTFCTFLLMIQGSSPPTYRAVLSGLATNDQAPSPLQHALLPHRLLRRRSMACSPLGVLWA